MNLFSLGVNILFSWLGNFVSDVWTQIWVSLNGLVYGTITLLYRVFVAIANVNLFDKDIFNKFTERMYLVVGIAMLFIFAYNLVLMIINPEEKKNGTGQMTKLVKNIIISLVLVVLLPTMFNYMAIFQKNILDSQIITKIIFGNGIDSSTDDCNKYENVKSDVVTSNKSLVDACDEYKDLSPSIKGAYTLTPTLFTAFLYPNNFSINQCRNYLLNGENTIESSDEKELCENYYVGFLMSNFTGNINYLFNSGITNTLKKNSQETLSFNYLLAFVAGIIAIIMFASYTIMIGVRVAKLGFLELIAPIPVMLRIIPEKKSSGTSKFDTWRNELTDTYLDIFVRMIIINFALYAISLVPGVIDQLGGAGDDNQAVVLLAKAIVILGILQFAKETPELIKEFFKGTGRFSIKGGFDKWKDSGKTMAGVAGMGATGLNRLANLGNNYARIAKNKDMTKTEKAKAMLKNSGRLLNPLAMASAMKSGYDNTKDGKDFLKGVNDATTKSLTSKGLLYKAKRNTEDAFEQFGRLATTDFTTQDTKKLKGIIATTDDFTKKQKGLFADIDDHKHVKAINNYYDRQIEEANKRGDFNAATQLGKDRKAAVEKMRQAVMEEMLKGHEAKVTLRSNGTFAISNDMRNINNDLIKSSASTALENINKIVNENPDLLKKALENNSLVMDADGKFSQTKFDKLVSDLNSGNTAMLDKVGKAMTNLNKTTNNTIIEIEQKNSGKK